MKVKLIPMLLAYFLFIQCNIQHNLEQPSLAIVKNVEDVYFGKTIVDPYRYMENLKDSTVQRWMKEQADYTTSVLAKIPKRDKLLKRIQELENATSSKIGRRVICLPNGNIFYLKRLASENVFKLYIRQGWDGIEKLLVDTETFEKSTGKPHAINNFSPSPDGKYVSYSVSPSGSEEGILYILEAETGKQIDKPIEREDAWFNKWLNDGSGFFYLKRKELSPDAPKTGYWINTKTYFHKIGTNPENDEVVFGNGVKGLEIDKTLFPYVLTIPGCNYVIGAIHTGVSPEFYSLYKVHFSKLDGINTPWEKICDKEEKISVFDARGDEFYFTTFKDAPRYNIKKISLADPNISKAEIILPESNAVIQNISVAKDALYTLSLDGGICRIHRISFDNKNIVESLELPSEGSIALIGNHAELDGIAFSLETWSKASQIYNYDPNTNQVINTNVQALGKYDAPLNIVSKEVMVKSHDGTMIPLSIIHNSDIKLRGKNPTFLRGYGAYGVTYEPEFSTQSLAWFENGGILAIAHVRGGGEFGDEWHKAGFKETKPNTWKDFISCAEYLVENKYTSNEYLVGCGTSAGGILIGRAITDRPDLFSSAIIRVGHLDALRNETTPNGIPNIPEFGTVKDSIEFEALLKMSSYNNVKNGSEYPAVLLTHGINDRRVEPWHSAKMTARLQAATSSEKPILLRINYESGHGIGSTKSQRMEEWADIFSFALWQTESY